MILHNFSNQNSLLNRFMSELRDIEIQKDSMRFRRNIERIGEILAYELSKTLTYKNVETQTPLGKHVASLDQENIVLCSILRAGMPLHNGLLNYFDQAENAFISAYRHHENNEDAFEIIVEYLASPELEGKTVILADPMLASGKSMINVYEALEHVGKADSLHLVSVLGAQEGIEYVSQKLPENAHLWIAQIDDNLNNRGYIVPGLGDAGDLCYGSKIDR